MLDELTVFERLELSRRLRETIRRHPDSISLRKAWLSTDYKPVQSIAYDLWHNPLRAIEAYPEVFLSLPSAMTIEPLELYGEKIGKHYEEKLKEREQSIVLEHEAVFDVQEAQNLSPAVVDPFAFQEDISISSLSGVDYSDELEDDGIPVVDAQTLKRIAKHLKYYLIHGEHPLTHLQCLVIEDVIKDIEAGHISGYIKRPTGTGKTVIFCAILDALQGLNEEFIEDGNDGMLVLVDTVNAAEQVYETLTTKKRWNNEKLLFGWRNDQVSIYYGTGKQATSRKKGEALGAPTVIMTIDAYRELEKRGERLRKTRPVVIIDEIDAAKGKVMTPFIRAITKSNFTIGLSATDRYVGPDGLVRIGPELFGREGPLHETTMMHAAEQGETSPVRNVLFVTNLESGIERKMRGEEREYTAAETEAIINQPGRDDAAIHAIATFVDPETNIAFSDLNQIWFCSGIKHAQRIAKRLDEIYQDRNADGSLLYPYGYAVAVSGQTSKEDWVDGSGQQQIGLKSILKLHREKIIPVITNADLLIRSFDSPSTELCVMLRPSRSPSLIEQTGGRVSRPDPSNSLKLAYVATFFDQDMDGAIAYTDVVGSSVLGLRQGVAYASNNGRRTPHIERMNPDRDVEIIVYFEPREIEDFFVRRRERRERLKAELLPPLPTDYFMIDALAKKTGIGPANVRIFYEIIMEEYNAVIANEETDQFFVGSIRFLKSEMGHYCRHGNFRKTVDSFALHERYATLIGMWFQKLEVTAQDFKQRYSFDKKIWFSSNDIAHYAKQYFHLTHHDITRAQISKIIQRMDVISPEAMQDPKTHEVWSMQVSPEGKSGRCLHKDDLTRFLRTYHFSAPMITNDWLAAADIADNLGAEKGLSYLNLHYIIQILDPLQEDKTRPHTMVDPRTGATWNMQVMRLSPQKTEKCLHKDDLRGFVDFYRLDLPPKIQAGTQTQEWLSSEEVADKAQVDLSRIARIFSQLEPLSDSADHMIDPRTQMKWRVEPRRVGREEVLCLNRSHISDFIKYYVNDTRPEGGDWLSAEDLAQYFGYSGNQHSAVVLFLNRLVYASSSGLTGPRYMVENGRLWKAEIFKYGNRNITCLHKSELERFSKHFGIKPPNILVSPQLPEGKGTHPVSIQDIRIA